MVLRSYEQTAVGRAFVVTEAVWGYSTGTGTGTGTGLSSRHGTALRQTCAVLGTTRGITKQVSVPHCPSIDLTCALASAVRYSYSVHWRASVPMHALCCATLRSLLTGALPMPMPMPMPPVSHESLTLRRVEQCGVQYFACCAHSCAAHSATQPQPGRCRRGRSRTL